MAMPHTQSALEATGIPGNLPDQTEDTIAHPPYRKISPHFPFFKLPPEMRLIIYEHLLVFPDKGIVKIELKSDHEASKHSCQVDRNSSVLRNRALNVLLVSKAVFAEAAKVFYSENSFKFESILACQAFLASRSLFTLKYIKSIKIHMVLDSISSGLDEKALPSLVKTLNFDLPSFECLSLTFCGMCPDVRRMPWDRHWYAKTPTGRPQNWLGVLLNIRKVKSLHISYNDGDPHILNPDPLGDDWDWSRETRGCMVAFASLVRAHLLRNAEELGNQNIRCYSRHCATFTLGRWKRKMERMTTVECHDDERGRSFLEELARVSPRQVGVREKGAREGNEPNDIRSEIFDKNDWPRYTMMDHEQLDDKDYEIGTSDTEDWDCSDDGDNDSLNGLDFDDINCTFVKDYEYLETFDQHPASS